MKTSRLLLSFCFVITLATTCFADTFDEAVSLYVGADYPKASVLFLELAEKGNFRAQHYLGKMYYSGEGVPKDLQLAIKWCKAAADQGSADAQIDLAYMYLPHDYQSAAKWYSAAAKQGYVEAQIALGFLYGTGQGVPQNHELAYAWLSVAEAKGANMRLGLKDFLVGEMTSDQIVKGQRVTEKFIKELNINI